MADRPHVLVLGGTAEAVALANAAARRFDVTYSLAGRTQSPSLPDNVTVRTGGFGGIAALSAWLLKRDIDLVIDATHPFAEQISANAATACDMTGSPRLRLLRPAWTSVPGDDWREVTDIAAAARLLPEIGSCGFLSIGRQELAVFADVPGVSFVARSINPPDGDNALPGATWLTGRGPFTMEQETTLLRDHGIDVVVSKNAGGDATYAKIAAARDLSIPVVMIARPAPPLGETVATVDAALEWLDATGGNHR